MKEIIEVLGRKPKSISEYKKIWRYLFGGDIEENKKKLKKQWQRHLNHTGPANITRGFCIFCEKEKSLGQVTKEELVNYYKGK